MKQIIDPFLYNLPHLDLHGCDRTIAVALIKQFVEECIKTNDKKLVIVHGKGSGVLKKTTHEYLRLNKYVKLYRLNNYNDGETIVELK